MDIIEQLYGFYKKSYTVTTDSRTVTENCIFVALKGEHFDGNDFAFKVANDGVAAAVIADRKDLPKHDRLFVVDNSLSTLQQLALHHRMTMRTPIIAITGTNGKTTTKELVSSVLSQKFNLVSTQGNFNNHLGVPLTILRIKPETEIAVVEMGANHPGEISQLALIGMPDYGLITNIGKAHLEGFGSIESVIKTKNEMYQHISEHNGMLFVNHDNSLLLNLSKNTKRLTYGSSQESDVQGYINSANPFLSVKWKENIINTQLIGDYNFENVMAAIAIGMFFKVGDHKIIEALESYTPTNSRSQVIKTANNSLILDAYNANPTSMSCAISNFNKICEKKNLLIIGDMRELGKESQAEHKTIFNKIRELGFKNVYFVGDEFSKVAKDSVYSTFENTEELCKYLENNKLKGYHVLIKGSNSVHLSKVVEYL
ncbi:MAG: UDP-N-acetylmuramoyl-tripeptide--D-alanyl-D-alanine ligase [Candidatus Limimorpha sp.]